MKKVSVNILNYNHLHYLKRAIPLVYSQNYPEVEINLIDNSSEDGSQAYVRQNFPFVRIIQNKRNLGYVGGHNRGIAETSGEYVLLLNPDVFMLENFIEQKVKAINFGPEVGMSEGKLLQIAPDEKGFPKKQIIDSTGIGLNPMLKNYDRGYGEEDRGQYDQEEFIFGPSGAAPLYRRKMLEDVRMGDEYFDSLFFMYREEVDLAWRAQLLNWKCRYTPKAVAYHVRGYSPKNRLTTPRSLRQLQFRNRYLLLVKMESLQNLAIHSPLIFLYEFFQLGYVLTKEPYLLKALGQFLILLPAALRKRKLIQANTRVSHRYMRQLFR